MKRTPHQEAVVTHRGSALLVAAAAGSGKTTVLVDRLLERVCDPDDPHDLDEFLIITYTKAAAAELRGKISKKLTERLAQQPENRHLMEQFRRLHLAQISTVHAFCADLLRDHAHLLEEVPADFRIGDEAECLELKQLAVERTVEASYETIREQPEIRAFVDTLGAGRDDRRIPRLLLEAYDRVMCHPQPSAWLAQCREALTVTGKTDAGETIWGAYLLEEYRRFLTEQRQAMETAAALCARNDRLNAAYGPTFLAIQAALEHRLACGGWDEIAAAEPMRFTWSGRLVKFEDAELKERVTLLRDRCKKGQEAWDTVFYGPSAMVLADLEDSAQALRGLFRMVEQFAAAYSREKRRRHLLDYSDLEHQAIALLTDETGAPSAAARQISNRWCEIMVDEYQDSNQVQDTIFRAVSQNGKNLFMVGDVKQSIYRFRLADPTIFLEKYRAYGETPEPGCPRRILLSENFRSHAEILDAANFVFRGLMSERVGDLTYGDDEALKPGGPAQSPELPAPQVELHCMEAGRTGPDKAELEAEFLADRIAGMLAGGELVRSGDNTLRPVTPGDIAILLRSQGRTAQAILESLQSHGIPVASDKSENILETTEISLLLSMLQILDNPRQDIPLIAVLSSGLFAFPPDLLAAIRSENRSVCFYEAMQLHREKSPDTDRFLIMLERLRDQSEVLPLHRLMARVIAETEMEEVFGAMPEGQRRVGNLRSFAESTAAGDRTLSSFLQYIKTLQEQGKGLQAEQKTTGGAVTIMSIHKSKGLEFPVVFLPDLSHKFNDEDLNQAVLLHQELFAGATALDRETMVRFPTIAKRALAQKIRRENRSEELRVLYVAMTRAKDRLIMSYAASGLEAALKKMAAGLTYPVEPAQAAEASNPGQWILMAALSRVDAGALHRVGGRPETLIVPDYPWVIRWRDSAEEEAAAPELTAAEQHTAPDLTEALRQMQYRYPWEAASKLPAKITPTQLKGRALDTEVLEDTIRPKQQKVPQRPQFRRQAELPVTGAEAGTAMHQAMQFVNLAACTDEAAAEAELDRLEAASLLTPRQRSSVRGAPILRLAQSELGRRISNGNATREFKFSLLEPSERYFPDTPGERLLMQGVVDCFLEEADGLVLIDFKTDRIGPEQLSERAARYGPQLDAYAGALERIYEKPVKEKLLYFFALNQTYRLP